MQIHIHKYGKTYGAFTLEQVRQYLKSGSFSGNDLACHDGAKWIKLADVRGIAQKTEESTKNQSLKPRPRKRRRFEKAGSQLSVSVYYSFLPSLASFAPLVSLIHFARNSHPSVRLL